MRDNDDLGEEFIFEEMPDGRMLMWRNDNYSVRPAGDVSGMNAPVTTSGRPRPTRRGALALTPRSALLLAVLAIPAAAEAQNNRAPTDPAAAFPVDRAMIARIREEGLKRSQLANTLSFMTDVLGGRLTNSRAMDQAQRWAVGEMERIGLVNIAREPFMPYGVSWDNEYVSVHMTAPAYQPLVAYPIAHTPGTDGKLELEVVARRRALAERPGNAPRQAARPGRALHPRPRPST